MLSINLSGFGETKMGRDPDTMISRIDVPRRLRRAILLNDLSLVKRIIRNNPKYLLNPDFEEKSNTSLHLAAKHGFTQIAVCHIPRVVSHPPPRMMAR